MRLWRSAYLEQESFGCGGLPASNRSFDRGGLTALSRSFGRGSCNIFLRQVDRRIFYGHEDKQEAARLEQGKHTYIGTQAQSNTRLVADYNSAGQDRKT